MQLMWSLLWGKQFAEQSVRHGFKLSYNKRRHSVLRFCSCSSTATIPGRNPPLTPLARNSTCCHRDSTQYRGPHLVSRLLRQSRVKKVHAASLTLQAAVRETKKQKGEQTEKSRHATGTQNTGTLTQGVCGVFLIFQQWNPPRDFASARGWSCTSSVKDGALSRAFLHNWSLSARI